MQCSIGSTQDNKPNFLQCKYSDQVSDFTRRGKLKTKKEFVVWQQNLNWIQDLLWEHVLIWFHGFCAHNLRANLEPVFLGRIHDISSDFPRAMWQPFRTLESGVPIHISLYHYWSPQKCPSSQAASSHWCCSSYPLFFCNMSKPVCENAVWNQQEINPMITI